MRIKKSDKQFPNPWRARQSGGKQVRGLFRRICEKRNVLGLDWGLWKTGGMMDGENGETRLNADINHT